jgi:sec-independent protein translocase protein TatA
MNTLLNAPSLLALFGIPGHMEIIALVVIGLLIFGKRLPEVGRNLGRSIVEFKKGIKGIGDDIDTEVDDKDTKGMQAKKSADLPPAKVTPNPVEEVDIKVEEAKSED